MKISKIVHSNLTNYFLREEIIKRYPGEVKYFTDTDNKFTHSTDDRYITLSKYELPIINVRIENIEN